MKAILHDETINQTKSFGTTSICIQARIQDEDRARKRGPSPYSLISACFEGIAKSLVDFQPILKLKF